MVIINLTDGQVKEVEEALECYDAQFIRTPQDGKISIGFLNETGKVIAGLAAVMTAFKILYVSTVFVDESYRRQGLGRQLMEEMETRAKLLGANTIRLDTFDWQGYDFYKSLDYQEVGHYVHTQDGYSEHFFVKFI
ncbi:GNAT family N-acetyltransferase [Streptococcus sp. S784/96/1]|uniref:GNAT family N-acetyltransferase n=1 Tax=Streptococcus sp. S784/96/1 TaxID=2653499 RepID=UPI00138669D9|nr:GNAT family N-acetyltransferase [Streptococcus sp. S784/96/1]